MQSVQVLSSPVVTWPMRKPWRILARARASGSGRSIREFFVPLGSQIKLHGWIFEAIMVSFHSFYRTCDLRQRLTFQIRSMCHLEAANWITSGETQMELESIITGVWLRDKYEHDFSEISDFFPSCFVGLIHLAETSLHIIMYIDTAPTPSRLSRSMHALIRDFGGHLISLGFLLRWVSLSCCGVVFCYLNNKEPSLTLRRRSRSGARHILYPVTWFIARHSIVVKSLNFKV